MNIPGFDAEMSLYKSARLYQGSYLEVSRIGTRASLVPQLDCDTTCALKWEICNIGCAFGGGGFLCVPGCLGELLDCESKCSDDGGGGPALCCPNPNRPYCCPGGARGCENLPNGKGQHCTGICVESAKVCHGAP
jgi:hypothetical protein